MAKSLHYTNTLAVVAVCTLLLTCATAVRDLPLETARYDEVDTKVTWKKSSGNSDFFLNSLRRESSMTDVKRRLLQSDDKPTCPDNATAICNSLPQLQISTIRANLISSCSNLIPETAAVDSCCGAINSGSSAADYNNTIACLCGDTGGLRAFVPKSEATNILQRCPYQSSPGPTPTPSSALTTASAVSTSSATANATASSSSNMS